MATAAVHPVHLTDNFKLWSFILSVVGTVALICGAWVTINNKVERNSTKIEAQETRIDKIDGKLDKIIDKLDVIELKVENKQDRPK